MRLNGFSPGCTSESFVETRHHQRPTKQRSYSIGPDNMPFCSLKNYFDVCPRLEIIGLDLIFFKIPSNPRVLDSLYLSRLE